MRSSGDGGGGPVDAVADMAATPPPASGGAAVPVLTSSSPPLLSASASVAAPVVVVTSTPGEELEDVDAHLLKVHSTGGLVHDGGVGLTNGTSSPLLTSLSVVDSLLMPMRASGDTRIVGNDVIAVADPFAFRHTYAKFVQAGPKRLQVLLDYDRTLTSFRHNGRPTDSCHGVVEKSHFASPQYRQQTDALFQKYYPLEVNASLARDDKLAAMIEWWEQAHNLMVVNRVHRDQIPTMVAESNMGLRAGARELLAELAEHNIPTLIFSAGIADVLIEFLRQQNALHPNIHVVSNRMRFGDDGYLLGFQGALIHTLNKNAHTLANSPEQWAHDVQRDHILLLGDNIGDIHMSDGLAHQQRIAIGFLNDRIQDNLPTYRATFDVVVLNDGSMELPRQLVQHIVTGRFPSEIISASANPM